VQPSKLLVHSSNQGLLIISKVAIFVYESLAGDMIRACRGLTTALKSVQALEEVAVVYWRFGK
jgi:hypothetical protein